MPHHCPEISALRQSLECKIRQIEQQSLIINELEELVEMFKEGVSSRDIRIQELERGIIRERAVGRSGVERETELLKKLAGEKNKNVKLEEALDERDREIAILRREKNLMQDRIERLTSSASDRNQKSVSKASSSESNGHNRSMSNLETAREILNIKTNTVHNAPQPLKPYKSLPSKSSVSKLGPGTQLSPIVESPIFNHPPALLVPPSRRANPSPLSQTSQTTQTTQASQTSSSDSELLTPTELKAPPVLIPKRFPKYDAFVNAVNQIDGRNLKRERDSEKEEEIKGRGPERKLLRRAGNQSEKKEIDSRTLNRGNAIKDSKKPTVRRQGTSNFGAMEQ